jgi:hypothetical protein
LFHLLVPGGKWQTVMASPVSSANCMDYPPHDGLIHPTSYSSKRAALQSKEASETIEWEQIPRHPTLA